MKKWFTLCMMLWLLPAIQAQDMNNQIIEDILKEISDSINVQTGMWEFFIEGLPMLCITDETHNRMRIISPVVEIENLKKGQLKSCMEANFHSALDVKYAISDEIIWSVFIHPLKELSESQFRDAVAQVWSASQTFGTTYSSTHLVFPGATENSGKKM